MNGACEMKKYMVIIVTVALFMSWMFFAIYKKSIKSQDVPPKSTTHHQCKRESIQCSLQKNRS
jgi:hypothetical protein